MKRSRTSYGPLFELDLDDELEEDGSRRGKGRKRPRYSVQNRMWRYREDSSSPEPDISPGSPEQDGGLAMKDAPAIKDGGVQTQESEPPQAPSTLVKTPFESGHATETPPSRGGAPRLSDTARTETDIQASASRNALPVSNEFREPMTAQNVSSPFGIASRNSDFSAFGTSAHAGFGIPQNPSTSTSQGFGQASTLFGTAPSHLSNQGAGQTSSIFRTSPSAPSNQGLGQTSSLFGTGPAPAAAPSAFAPAINTGSAFGAASGSLRFGFGQEPQPEFGASPFVPSQPSMLHPPPHPYPESFLDERKPLNLAPAAPQDPLGGDARDDQFRHGLAGADQHHEPGINAAGHEVSLWPMGTQSFDSSHSAGRLDIAEDLHSDGSVPLTTPSGMIPPEVEDGTRNVDEMRHEGLLSTPVFQQGIPQEAFPDREDTSAGVEEDSVNSDEEATYDESEKGDDYDLRNYDRVSDDEEGYDDEHEPLADDELLDEGAEHFVGEEEDYDEEDYEEEDSYYPQAPQWPPNPLPQPSAQKEPIVIDLLSDSDEDEPPAVQAPQPQSQLHEPDEFVKYESEEDHEEQLSQEDSRSQQDDEESDEVMEDHQDEDAEESFEEEDVSDDDADELNAEDSEGDGGEPERHAPGEDVISIGDANIKSSTINMVAEVEQAATMSPGQSSDYSEAVSQRVSEEQLHAEINAVNQHHKVQRLFDGKDDAMAVDEERHDDLAESFQTQPAEMLASFNTQMTGATNPSLDRETSDNHVGDDIVEQEIRAGKYEDDQGFASQNDAAEEGSENDLVSQQADEIIEFVDESLDKERAMGEAEKTLQTEASVTKDLGDLQARQDEPPSPPVSQHQEDSDAPRVNISMTTVTSHVETQTSNQQQTTSETVFESQETKLIFTENADTEADHQSVTQEKDTEMEDTSAPAGSESSPHQDEGAQSSFAQDSEEVDAAKNRDLPDVGSVNQKQDITSVPSPRNDTLSVKKQRSAVQVEESHPDDEGESFHEAIEMPEAAKSSPIATPDLNASFMTTDSQVTEAQDTEEAETAPTAKPKRGGRKTRTSGSKSAKSTPASKKGQRQSSSQQAPSSQRTTRSKTMSFQQADSPNEEKEDMSIQLARAALKSPTTAKSKRKVSATTAKRLTTDLLKRLGNDMPDCAPLKDLRKYNSRTLDIAAVATSAHTAPKRTMAREYASSFTITDPSFAPDGVVEVDLYSLHRDHLPVVKTGDAVLLRGFTVVSLPGRGFGLKTDKNQSSWAVYEADGEDNAPQMRAAPVEMNEKESRFLLDLRAWFTGLDEDAREKLGKAVDEMVENGRESRAKI